MAQMIPAYIDTKTRSQAEQKVFRALKYLEGTEEWVVLHSVALAETKERAQGEIDFIVMIPDRGVFVLEVKGGEISYEEGRWFATEHRNRIQDPFAQANRNLHNFIEFIMVKSKREDNFSNIRMGYAVVFPDITFDGISVLPDVAEEQVLDAVGLFPENLYAYFERLASFYQTRTRDNLNLYPPNLQTVQKLRKFLRPKVDWKLSLSTEIQGFDYEIIQMTNRQSFILESLMENARCLIRGGAGTGKTLLAKHFANLLIEQEKRFAFFCYNRRLAQHIRSFIDTQSGSVVHSFTDYMDEWVREFYPDEAKKLRDLNQDKYYRYDLPELFLQVYIEEEMEPFDVLIIDEAQDLMSDAYLLVLDQILVGGLEKGMWYFFGDMENQNIFMKDLEDDREEDRFSEISAYAAKFRLRENCRNTPKIIQEMDRIFGSKTLYMERTHEGIEVRKKIAKSEAALLPKLEEELEYLIKQGVKPENISILSHYSWKNSVVSDSKKFSIIDAYTREEGSIQYSSIAGFKGMENQVVILVLDQVTGPNNKDLLYIGMSRARTHLSMVMTERVEKDLRELLEG